MSATITTTKPQIIVEERVVLQGISWETYERLMKDYENRSAPRFTYDRGTLEIYMPTLKHEETNRFFEAFVNVIIEERDLDMRSLGSTTYRRADLDQGVEPDCCFYIQTVDKIAGVKRLDLSIHPPPDLVVEVDVTSPSIDKFPIYAALQVLEIWGYGKEQISIYVLRNKKYIKTKESIALRGVTAEVLTHFLAQSQTLRRPEWLGNVRKWAQGQDN